MKAENAPAGFVRPTFEQLYRSARRWLPKALRRFGVQGDAEDLLHDVVMIAHRRLDHFDPTTAHPEDQHDPAHALRAWMLGIARHRVAKRRRAASRGAALPGMFGAELVRSTYEAPSVEDVAAAEERRRILRGVLAKLKLPRAEVFILHAIFDKTAPEIARELGVNENTVRSRINRARRDVRQAIERLPREDRSALYEGAQEALPEDCRERPTVPGV